MTRLAAKGLSVDLQIMDNEASAAFKQSITFAWRAKFQLVPPDMHRRNRAERAIHTFKDHFLAILAGIDPSFPPYLWDLLLPQAELTLNLLRQSSINEKISAWEFFNGPFDFNKTPLGPASIPNLPLAAPGIFEPKKVSISDPPLSRIGASNLSKWTPRAKSFPTPTRLSFVMLTAPSRRLRPRIGLSMVSVPSRMRSPIRRPQRPFPNWRRYPISETSSNRGASWHLAHRASSEVQCRVVQGWSCLTHRYLTTSHPPGCSSRPDRSCPHFWRRSQPHDHTHQILLLSHPGRLHSLNSHLQG